VGAKSWCFDGEFVVIGVVIVVFWVVVFGGEKLATFSDFISAKFQDEIS
jgi:hypothetical protein